MVKTFIITGDTWSSREDLKSLGGRWVPHLNAWLVPDTEHQSVARLRREIEFDVQLVSLPVHIPFHARQRLEQNRRTASSHLPSPAAS